MTFMITPSNDDKSDICQFFYQDFFHIVNTVMYKILCKIYKIFLRYNMLFHRGPISTPSSPDISQKPSPGRVK